MTTKNVQFSVEIKGLEVTSGSYQVRGIVDGQVGAADVNTFEGNGFSVVLNENESEYFAVTVFIETYTHHGVSHTIEDKPFTLLATFYLPDADEIVKISPESSIASIYTFARITTIENDGLVNMNGTERNMKIAYGMKQNLYLTKGIVADMIKNSPNGFETNSYPMFNSLCNLLYYCLTDSDFYKRFLELAWHDKNKPNNNFLQAVRNILHDPFANAAEIYRMLIDKPEIYEDSLTSMKVSDNEKAPNNWTLTIKSNKSGSKNFIPSGTAFVVFDADDNAWVANNFRAGSGDSGTHCPVYKYNAEPADFSPVQGGGLIGVGFGAAIDPKKEYISFGGFGWGSEYNNPQEGSIARFYYKDGKPVSPSNGFTPGLSRVQGMDYDMDGNLWMASVGCQDPFAPAPTGAYPFKSEPSAVVVYLNGEPDAKTMLVCNEFPVKRSALIEAEPMKTPYLKVFDVTPDNDGSAYVSCIGNYDDDREKCALSAVYKVTVENGKLVVKASWFSDYLNESNNQRGFESLRQVAINGDGDVVVVGVASSRATILEKDTLKFKGYYDVNTHNPWGVKIDKKETVFLANFGHDAGSVKDGSLDLNAPFGVTMLRDPSNKDSARLLTVPTGGSEVMLDNGHPLYGSQTRPGEPITLVNDEPTPKPIRMKCFQPIMRLTSTNIDGAGNLWCMNNWKPSALVDVADNPGGDGVVIFLGIAEPE